VARSARDILRYIADSHAAPGRAEPTQTYAPQVKRAKTA
jgi:hypothetical protein